MNEAQLAAAHSLEHTSVIAPPGSGKTHTLVERCAHLANTFAGVRIINVTFTREAADEMQTRVARRVGASTPSIVSNTFHSLCKSRLVALKLLPERIIQSGYRSHLLRKITAEVAFKHKVNLKDGDAGVVVEQLKRFGINPTEYDPWKQDVLALYEKGLRDENCVDLSDLVLRYLKRLADGTIEPFRADFLHVDEYQDTDAGQLDFVLRHANSGCVTTIVADDDQAIYSFRASLGYQGVTQFEEQLNARRIILTTNYRSRAEIVESANALVAKNVGMRIEKHVHAERGQGGKVQVIGFAKREDEAAHVRMVLQANPYAGWAVIARNNADLILLQMELIVHGVPFVRLGPGLGDGEITAAFLSLLRASTQRPLNEQAIEYFLCALGAPMADAALLLAQESGALTDAVKSLRTHLGHPSRRSEKSDMDSWLASVGVIAEQMLASVNALYNPSPKAMMRRATQLDFVTNSLLRLNGSLLQRLALIEKGSNGDEPSVSDGRAVLLTAHASKGMEFPKVWIVQVSEGTLPSSESGANIWEERRLLFVAMTRAKDELYISYSDTKSAFIDEVQERG